MAVLDMHEQEQVEALKSWWQENRMQLLVGLLIAVVVIGGWRGWQYYQNKLAHESAALYAEISKQLETGDAKRVNDAVSVMTDKFGATAYAPRAALLAARLNEQNKDMASAKAQLQWVADHSGEAGLKDVARLRLAAILLDEKNYADALLQLAAGHAASFDGLYADMRGDVLSAQGRHEEAKAAYQLAIDKTDARSMYRNLIQLKLDALMADKGAAAK